MSEQADIEKAIKTAEQILNAIKKKFPKYEGFVRRHELSTQGGYIELMIRPENSGKSQEITAAYADEYFTTATKENINEKAAKIFRDFRQMVGAHG